MINYHSAIPSREPEDTDVFLAIMKADIPHLAEKYIDYIETSVTQEVCKCDWVAHPDDVGIRAMHCRECTHPREKHTDIGDGVVKCASAIKIDDAIDGTRECECSQYVPRRVRKADENPFCPVHTSVGRVMGFFEYVFKKQGPKETGGLMKSNQERSPRG